MAIADAVHFETGPDSSRYTAPMLVEALLREIPVKKRFHRAKVDGRA